MRVLNFCIFLITINFSCYSQTFENKDLVGIWQFNNRNIASGWLDNYQFFPNGKFCFNTNQNDSTKRIISIGGTYLLKNNILTLQTTYSKEIYGGHLERSETAGGSGWEVTGGKVITIKFKSKIISHITLEKCDDKEDVSCILLDKRIHFKLENNPINYN